MYPDPDPKGSASFWKPGSASGSASAANKYPDPHQTDKLDPDPDPHQFADAKPKCMQYEPILAIFQVFLSLCLQARIWIRIEKSDPDPHQIKKSESGSASG